MKNKKTSQKGVVKIYAFKIPKGSFEILRAFSTKGWRIENRYKEFKKGNVLAYSNPNESKQGMYREHFWQQHNEMGQKVASDILEMSHIALLIQGKFVKEL